MIKPTPTTDWDKIDFDHFFLPGISIDTVIFGFHQGQLMVLLFQFKNTDLYALPCGFILKEENGDDAAYRILKERTGLSNIFLKQFHTSSAKDRCNPTYFKTIMEARGMTPSEDHFLLRRFVSVGYYALVDFTKVVPVVDPLADDCQWHNLKELPPLIQDHTQIIEKALHTLREDLEKKLVGFNLLPDMFTIGELQSLYETILEKRFLRTSFQRSMLNLGVLEMVAKKSGVAHKSPYLYKYLNH